MHNPPKLPLHFFRWYCHPRLQKYIEGDLMELYDERLKTSGKRKADLKFVVDVLLLFRPGIIRPSEGHYNLNQYDMFKNYFKVGIRNILKYKVFSFINVFGLAVAMSVCMLIILMLADQKSYDQFHEKKDRIYRILAEQMHSKAPTGTSPVPLANTLKTEYPVVEEVTRLMTGIGGDATYNQRTIELRGFFADASFFNVFTFDLEMGNPQSALLLPNSIVLTRSSAKRLFNNENPLGKIVEFENRGLHYLGGNRNETPPAHFGSYKVTGVIADSQGKSHLKFDALVSSSSMPVLIADKKIRDLSNDWQNHFECFTYVLLSAQSDRASLTASLNDLVTKKYSGMEERKGFKLMEQKLTEITPGIFIGNPTSYSLPLVAYYFLAFLALVIMVSACVNYTNLSTARILTRAKEIGVRKVTGAQRKNLVLQFLSESILTAFFALAMAAVLLITITPAFQDLWINQYLNFDLRAGLNVYFIFIGFALLIGIVAGIYPAFHLSGYQPIKALKNIENTPSGKWGMKKVLSVSQFVISLFFITTSILIFNQFKHFLAFEYGFNTRSIVNVVLQSNDYKKVSTALSSVPGVSTISACDIVPATGVSNQMGLRLPNSTEGYKWFGALRTDENFVENLELRIVAGRNLSPRAGESSDRFILVNEAAVKELGYQFPSDAIGQVYENEWDKEPVEIVGVVNDFQFRLLFEGDKIGPLVLCNRGDFIYANVKITSADLMGTVAQLEDKWKQVDPVHAFKYDFFDDQLAATHQAIFDVVSILGFIAFLAIVIACLGLLGMATYRAERKTKEIGIRRILGAADLSIALLLSKEFLKMLGIAILIGAPLSYFINNLWLQHFPNRVNFGMGTVFLGTLVLLVLGLITIGSQIITASKRNPVDSLKSD